MRLAARQIAAAMALAGMTQDELANAAGIARPSLNRILNEEVVAKEDTLGKIRQALEALGLEFLDNQGVRLKPHNMETFEGREGFVRFFETVHHYLETYGGEICVGGVDESLFVKYQGDYANQHMDKMLEITQKNSNINMRILIEEGDKNFVASHYATYKWLPKKYFLPTAMYVFGENLALISFTHDPAPLVILIQSAAFAEAYRHSFNMLWEMASNPVRKK